MITRYKSNPFGDGQDYECSPHNDDFDYGVCDETGDILERAIVLSRAAEADDDEEGLCASAHNGSASAHLDMCASAHKPGQMSANAHTKKCASAHIMSADTHSKRANAHTEKSATAHMTPDLSANALNEFIPLREAAKLLGHASPTTLHRWAKAGRIPGAVKISNLWLLPRTWVEDVAPVRS
jgi:hypothetical protein